MIILVLCNVSVGPTACGLHFNWKLHVLIQQMECMEAEEQFQTPCRMEVGNLIKIKSCD
jgi:hypothetical protein